PGRDTVTYADHAGAVNIDINNNPDDGEPNENDDVRNDNEVIIGGPGDDDIAGDENGNTLIGGSGDDTLLRRGGNDTLDGGAGDAIGHGRASAGRMHAGAARHIANYASHQGAISVSNDAVANDGEPGEGDTLASDIEGVIGSMADDRCLGGPGNDFISAFGGN